MKSIVRIATAPAALVSVNVFTLAFTLGGLLVNVRLGRWDMVAMGTLVVAAVSIGLALSVARLRVLRAELREAALKAMFAANMMEKLKTADSITLHGSAKDDDDDTPFGRRH